jgi:hypothetical protein
VLWSPQTGPLCAYTDPVLAHSHARTMLGVQVAETELRVELPEIAKNDLVAEFNEEFEDSTPIDEIPLEEIEDAAAVEDTKIIDVDG